MPTRKAHSLHRSFAAPLVGVGLALLACAVPAAPPPSPDAGAETRFVDALLARMTLEEKLGQLNQPPGIGNDTGPAARTAGEDQIRKGLVGSILGMHGVANVCPLQKIAVEQSRLGIPLLFGSDVIHGFRTIFPQPLGESAAFDPAASERAARIAAIEASAHGVHWTYAPMVDIARDPRWGRVSEGSGEDPYLGSALAAARVRGFQGGDLSRDGAILATAKHFVAYGAAEAGRDYNTTDMSERTLREVYLPPFKAAVDAGARTVMAAFNSLNGTPMHANGPLIDGVLRKEWGFDGIVVSDYTGIMELLRHAVAADPTEAAILGIGAGVDIDMVSGFYVDDLPAAVRAGKVPVAEVDAAVRRVLRAKYDLGLFRDPYRYCDAKREQARTLTPEFRQASREAARESMVLLRNEGGVLPLSKSLKTIAAIGPLADNARVMNGNWAGDARESDAVTPLQGLRDALPNAQVLFAKGAGISGDDRSGFEEAVATAKRADAVVLFLGEDADMSGEASSRTDIGLPGVQEQLALAVQATGKPVVLVLFNGRPLTLGALPERMPAILDAWFPGTEAGHAIADVLFGDYNPAGRLPITFPRNVGQVPIYYAQLPTGRPPDAKEKYTSKYLDAPWTPQYPFGYGLSYTRFRYDALKLQRESMRAGDTQVAEVTVANTGKRAGDEVVQLYLRDDVASVSRPVRMLRGFQRIHLEPGERRTLRFELKPQDLGFYDANLRWVVEPGHFTVFAGGSSEAALEAGFEVE
ncbi:MAG: beta-glucosidase BglX [Thermomonas sp.]